MTADRWPLSRRGTILAVVAVLASMAAALFAKSWCGIPGDTVSQYLHWCYSDVPPLYYSERLAEGAVPYLDHAVEYPVLTGLWMGIAAALARDVTGFFWWTAVLLVASAVVTTVLLVREVGVVRALAFALAPTLMISGAVNWDLPAVALATAGIVAHRRGRDGWSGVWLGLGTAAKLFPGLLLLLTVPAAWRLRGRRAGLVTGGAALAAWAAVNVPVLLAAPRAWWRFFELSSTRPPDWDSLYTLVANASGASFGTGAVNLVSALLFAVGATAIVTVAVRRDPAERWHLAALPLLAGFLLANKVYSPQFSLWLLPLFALSFPGWGWLAAFAVADVAVTLTRFPYLAEFVGDGIPGAWSYGPFGFAVLVRAVVLGAAAFLGWRETANRPHQNVAGP